MSSTYRKWFVNIGPVVGKTDNYIRTLSVSKDSSSQNTTVPLVLLHGFGSAIGLWVLNLDSLSDRRSIYALDLLGFGRSSRPKFSSSAEVVEAEYVESKSHLPPAVIFYIWYGNFHIITISGIEKWRQHVGLERFVLLGHSLGAYLASSYALAHPERIAHLILADPWGYPEKSIESASNIQLPTWVKIVGTVVQKFNPLAAVRAAGPIGEYQVQKN